jgi:hypothetical protein
VLISAEREPEVNVSDSEVVLSEVEGVGGLPSGKSSKLGPLL